MCQPLCKYGIIKYVCIEHVKNNKKQNNTNYIVIYFSYKIPKFIQQLTRRFITA